MCCSLKESGTEQLLENDEKQGNPDAVLCSVTDVGGPHIAARTYSRTSGIQAIV
jgi:hypothetical protein